MSKGIRPYGPGKYNQLIDSHASAVALDLGSDEELSLEQGGYYALIRVDRAFRKAVEEKEELTDEEYELLRVTEAIIFYERSDGIVEAEWFDDVEEANDEWAAIEEELGEEEEEDD